MYMFKTPRMIRKPADTEVPMMEPILLKVPNLELMAEAVAATTMEVIVTMLGGGSWFGKKWESRFGKRRQL